MAITINENHLLDVLEECLPYLRFCRGGCNVEEILGKVELILRMAGREIENAE